MWPIYLVRVPPFYLPETVDSSFARWLADWSHIPHKHFDHRHLLYAHSPIAVRLPAVSRSLPLTDWLPNSGFSTFNTNLLTIPGNVLKIFVRSCPTSTLARSLTFPNPHRTSLESPTSRCTPGRRLSPPRSATGTNSHSSSPSSCSPPARAPGPNVRSPSRFVVRNQADTSAGRWGSPPIDWGSLCAPYQRRLDKPGSSLSPRSLLHPLTGRIAECWRSTLPIRLGVVVQHQRPDLLHHLCQSVLPTFGPRCPSLMIARTDIYQARDKPLYRVGNVRPLLSLSEPR